MKLGLNSKSFTRNCFHDPLFTSGGSGEGNGRRLASFPGQLWEAEAEFLPELLREKQAGVLLSGERGHKDKVGRYGEPANTCVNVLCWLMQWESPAWLWGPTELVRTALTRAG